MGHIDRYKDIGPINPIIAQLDLDQAIGMAILAHGYIAVVGIR